MDTTIELHNKLAEQAHLLQKAIDEFYAGDTIEALSIAVIIRTLVHETKKSTPLLKLLTPNYTSLKIKNKAPNESDQSEKNARRGRVTILQTMGMAFGPGGVRPKEDLSSPSYELVPLESWWNRACLIFPRRQFVTPNAVEHAVFSKRDLTLILANKEGGTHVDVKLPEDYVALVQNSPIKVFANGAQSDSVNLARYAVAQTGVELLECVRRNFAGGAG
jgi:hypothetical protein